MSDSADVRSAGPGSGLTFPAETMPHLQPSPCPERLGFRGGTNSVHTSRTLMLDDLSAVLGSTAVDASAESYRTAIVEENVLGKATRTTRDRSARRLAELYALDPRATLFRLLRKFWIADRHAQPMLAYLTAAARDPLLRETTGFVLAIPLGQPFEVDAVGVRLSELWPGRFKPSTLNSTARNLASSWTQAGYLTGKVNKTRSRPIVTPSVTAFALLLGYLCGLRSKSLLDSSWTRLLDRTPVEVADLAVEASRQGWLTYKAAGRVVEITFPGLLTPQEERATSEPT